MITSESEIRQMFVLGVGYIYPWKLFKRDAFTGNCTSEPWAHLEIIKVESYNLIINPTIPFPKQLLCLQMMNQCK
jgi:hypothetical protein